MIQTAEICRHKLLKPINTIQNVSLKPENTVTIQNGPLRPVNTIQNGSETQTLLHGPLKPVNPMHNGHANL